MRNYEVSYRNAILVGTLVMVILSVFGWLFTALHIILPFLMTGHPVIPFSGGFITTVLVKGKTWDRVKAGIVSSFLAACILDGILLSMVIVSQEHGFAAGLAGIAVFLIAISFLIFGAIGSIAGSLLKTHIVKQETEQK